MRLGFRHTAFQAVCTVLVLCFALGLLQRADTVQPVFGEDSVRVPILMYHSILKGQRTAGQSMLSRRRFWRPIWTPCRRRGIPP